MTTGQKLRRAMEARQLSQHKLAKASGVTQSAICKYLNEGKEPQDETLTRLAEAMGVKPEDLRGDGVVAYKARNGISLRMSQAILRLIESKQWELRMSKDREFEFVCVASPGSPLYEYVKRVARARRYLDTEGLDDAMYDDLIAGLTERYEDAIKRRMMQGGKAD